MSGRCRLYHLAAAVLLSAVCCTLACPDEWVKFRDKCYKSSEEKTSWQEASGACERYGGSLVSIHDKETNDLLYQTLGANINRMWIGWNFQTGPSWTDGSPRDFKFWDKYEPEIRGFHGLMKYCVAMGGKYTDKWATHACWAKLNYICQVSQGSLTLPDKAIQGGSTGVERETSPEHDSEPQNTPGQVDSVNRLDVRLPSRSQGWNVKEPASAIVVMRMRQNSQSPKMAATGSDYGSYTDA